MVVGRSGDILIGLVLRSVIWRLVRRGSPDGAVSHRLVIPLAGGVVAHSLVLVQIVTLSLLFYLLVHHLLQLHHFRVGLLGLRWVVGTLGWLLRLD